MLGKSLGLLSPWEYLVWEQSCNGFTVCVFEDYILISLLCLCCCLFNLNDGLFFFLWEGGMMSSEYTCISLIWRWVSNPVANLCIFCSYHMSFNWNIIDLNIFVSMDKCILSEETRYFSLCRCSLQELFYLRL